MVAPDQMIGSTCGYVTLFRKEVFEDVIKSKTSRRDHPGLNTGPYPMASVLFEGMQRKPGDTDTLTQGRRPPEECCLKQKPGEGKGILSLQTSEGEQP